MQKYYYYLIIGTGIAGTTAAEAIRQIDGDNSIGLVGEEPYRLYSRIMLSKPSFFLEQVRFDSIWMKEASWYTEKNIDLQTSVKALAIDAEKKEVTFSSGERVSYEKLLIATGACPRQWNISGGDKKGVYALRSLDEGKAIMQEVKTAKTAVAIGAGFISFEIADLLRQKGLEVSLVNRNPCFWANILGEGGKIIDAALEAGGVRLYSGADVSAVLGDEHVSGVRLATGEEISCDMVVCGIGTVCPLEWFHAAGLKTQQGLLVDAYLQTSDTNIWAAGDVVEYYDVILNDTLKAGSWMAAQQQGKIAGMNMAGKHEPYKMVSFYTTKGFGFKITFVGDVRCLEGRELISRQGENSFTRLIVKEGRLVGAVLVNNAHELGVVRSLIETQQDISGSIVELSQNEFDLKNLIS